MELLRSYLNCPILPNPDKLIQQARSNSVFPRIHRIDRRLEPAVIEQLVADYQAGVPTTQLTQRYGIGEGAVLRLLDAHGVVRRHQPLTPEQSAEAIELYQSGLSLAKVGERLGGDASLIHLTLKRAGVPRRDAQGH